MSQNEEEHNRKEDQESSEKSRYCLSSTNTVVDENLDYGGMA